MRPITLRESDLRGLHAPQIRPIDPSGNLLAESVTEGQTQTEADTVLRDAAEALLAELQPRFNFIQGDVAMLVMDVPPEIPPQYAPVLVAEAPKTPAPVSLERTIGVCHLIDNRPELVLGAVNAFTPVRAVNYYFKTIENNYLGLKGTTTLLEGPKHGELEDLGSVVKDRGEIFDSGARNYAYRAKGDYIGPDQATFLVEIGGYKVKAVYHFKVMQSVPHGGEQGNPYTEKEYCPNGRVWKISLNPDDPNAPIYTFEHPYQLTSPYAGLSKRRAAP